MPTVDNRIVNIEFKNEKFQRNVQDTVDSIEGLKKGLNLDAAAQSLQKLQVTGDNFTLGGIAAGVQQLTDRFSVMGIVGMTIVQNLTNGAIAAGRKIAGFLIGPIVDGGIKRAESIAQAKFQFEGLGMDIEKTMASALEAVNGTAYGLGDAAMVASQFGASGLRAGDEMLSSLRAVAGVAAMTGREYSDIGRIFVGVAGNGRLMGNDLLQLSSSGINAAATLAKAMGVTEAEVRQMVSDGKISFKMFSDAMDEAFGKHAQDANKLFSGSLANVKAALSRIGAEVAAPAFENLRDILNALRPIIDNVHKSLMPLISVFNSFTKGLSEGLISNLNGVDLAPLAAMLDSIHYAFKGLYSIVIPIKEAFQEILPAKTTTQLMGITNALRDLTSKFKLGDIQASNLKDTFKGVFTIIDIGLQIILNLGKALAYLAVPLLPIADKLLYITAAIGRFLVEIDKSISRSTIFTETISHLASVITPVANFIADTLTALTEAFNSLWATGKADGFTGDVSSRFSGLNKIIGLLYLALSNLIGAFSTMFPIFGKLASIAGGALKQFGDIILKTLNDGNFKAIFDMINGTLFAGILVGLNKYIYSITNIATKGGFLQNITGVFNGVRASLRLWQQELQAKIIKSIAISIAILAASLVAISLIDSAKLTSSLAAIGALLAQLFASMAFLGKIAGGPGIIATFKIIAAMQGLGVAILILAVAMGKIAKLDWPQIIKGLTTVIVLMGSLVGASILLSKYSGKMSSSSVALVIMAGAIFILTSAIIKLSTLNWEQIQKGLTTVITLLAALIGASILLSKYSGKMSSSSLALVVMAGAIFILASVITKLSTLSWEQIQKGLTTVITLLASLVGASILLSKYSGKMSSSSIGLLAMAGAIFILSLAITKLSTLSWEQIQKGLSAVAGLMTVLVGASVLLSKYAGSMVTSSIGLLILSGAIVVLANALKTMGSMTWDQIIIGLTGLAGVLVLLVGASVLLSRFGTAALPGATALLIMAAALSILTPVLKTLGSMSLVDIGTALLAIAGIFVILGLSALILAPLVPVILALGAAVVLLGVGALAIGGGLMLFAAGLTALGIALAASGGGIVLFITSILGLIPMLLSQIGVGLVAFAKTIATAAPAFVSAITTVVLAIVKGLVTILPKLLDGLLVILTAVLDFLVKAVPMIADAGLKIIMGLLGVLIENIGRLVTAGANLIVGFLDGIATKLPAIIQSAFEVVISFINGLADAIRSNAGAIAGAVSNLIDAITGGVSGSIGKFVDAGTNVIAGFIQGMKSKISEAASWAANMGTAVLQSAKDALGIKSPSKAFRDEVGLMIINGLSEGIDDGTTKVLGTTKDMSDATLKEGTKGATKWNAVGNQTAEEMAAGIKAKEKKTAAAAKELTDAVFQEAKKTIDDRKFYNKITAEEEITIWDNVRKKYVAGSEAYKEADKEVYRVRKEIEKKAYDDSIGLIDDRKYYNKLSLAEEYTAWSDMQKKYSEGTEERKKADREVYRIEKELGKSGFDNAVQWIDDHKYYNELSLNEELEAWQRIQKTYSEGTEERKKADREVYRVKQELIAKHNDLVAKQKQLDDDYSKNVKANQDQLANDILNLNKQYEADTLQIKENQVSKQKQLDDDYYASTKAVTDKLNQDIIDLNTTYDEAIKSRADSLYSAYSLFERITTNKPVSGTQLITNLEDQAVAFDAWKNDINGLSGKGIASGLMDELKAMGPKSAGEIKALNSLTAPELDKYVALWQAKHLAVKEQAVLELEGLRLETATKIQTITAQSQTELEALRVTWSTQMLLLSTDTATQLATLTSNWNANTMALIIKSQQDLTTLRTTWAGQMALLTGKTVEQVTDLTTQWGTQVDTLKTDTETKFVDLNASIATIVNSYDWAGLGGNIIAGMTAGVVAKAQMLAQAAAAAALMALMAAKAALGINSPSKEFAKLGMYSMQGFADGLTNFAGLASSSAESAGSSAMLALKNTISKISDVISGEMDISPVIRPVLDLTDVMAGGQQLDQLFSRGLNVSSITGKVPVIGQTSTVNQNGNTQSSGTYAKGDITFTQNNYSPKALSRLEIYRQTKNQISTMKGLVGTA